MRGNPWSGRVWGAFVLLLGAWWGLGELGAVPFTWDLVGPLALVAVGAGMVLGRGACADE